MSDEKLISTLVLAAQVRMSRDKVRRLAHAGDIPSHKRGREYWFDLEAVREALRNKR